MTDAELIEHLRILYHALDEELTVFKSNPDRAKAAIREAQEGIDEAVVELLRRGSLEETKH